jgi:hypothetical protein
MLAHSALEFCVTKLLAYLRLCFGPRSAALPPSSLTPLRIRPEQPAIRSSKTKRNFVSPLPYIAKEPGLVRLRALALYHPNTAKANILQILPLFLLHSSQQTLPHLQTKIKLLSSFYVIFTKDFRQKTIFKGLFKQALEINYLFPNKMSIGSAKNLIFMMPLY